MRCLATLIPLLALVGCDDADPARLLDQGAVQAQDLGEPRAADADLTADATPLDRPDAEVDGHVADGGARDAAMRVGAAPTIEIEYAPRRFNACWESCNVESLRFAVEDPDGVDDLAGGRVIVQPTGAVVADLPAMTRRHSIDLTWRALHEVQSIDFDGNDAPLQLRIEYADRAGNAVSADVETRLVCPDGGPACAGRCADGDCFPFERACGSNRACEYHPSPGGDDGRWTCDRTGAGRLGALCGPDAPCATGFSCFRRETVGCEGFAPSDGCCTPRCRPEMDACPDGMRCLPLGGDRACVERLGFCVFQ